MARPLEIRIKYLPYIKGVTLKEMEYFWITKAFKYYGKNITATAHGLGIGRATLYRRLNDIKRNHKKSDDERSQRRLGPARV